MTSPFFHRSLAATALGAFLLFAPPADAQSVRDKMVSILVEALKTSGVKDITYGAVAGDDAEFSISDFKATIEQEGKSVALTAAKTTYTGAKPAADGGYTAAGILITELGFKEEETEVTIDSWKITNYSGQGPALLAVNKGLGDTFERMELTGIVVDNSNMEVPIASVVLTTAGHVGGIPRKGTFDIKGIVVPIDPDNDETKEFAALGYKEVALDVAMAAGWDEKAERIAVDNFSIVGKDMGALKFAFSLGGASADAMKQLQAAKDDNAKQLEVLQGLSIESISIRFDNASIVDRVLDAQAKAQGTTRAQYVTGLAAAVPLMIQAIGNKDFEKKVADAVGAFLKGPKSIAVLSKPAQAVPIAQIVGTVLVAPQSLPGILAVDIQANK